MSTPRITKLSQEQLDTLKDADFYPNRLSKDDNSKERMTAIQEEAERLFKHPSSRTPMSEEYPMLYKELPTLWALIEEGKFRYWVAKDQSMLRHMITLNQKVVAKQMSNDDAEKTAGDLLATRFLPNSSRGGASGNTHD
jgi:hypothetical protein